jgi:hypothetical protein
MRHVLMSRRCHASRRASQPAAGFVPIITEATSATLAARVIEVTLAGAVVRVASGMDDATLTTVRASALRP